MATRVRRARWPLVLGSIVVAAAMVELGLSVAASSLARFSHLREYRSLISGANTGLFAPDPYSLYRHIPGSHKDGSVQINEDGFRTAMSAPPSPKNDNEVRILLIGGSTTFGVTQSDEDTWAARLTDKLNAMTSDIVFTVVNAGVGGYTTAESIGALALRGLEYDPDIVLIHHVYNDVNARTVNDGFKSDYSHYRPSSWRPDDRLGLLRWSSLYNLAFMQYGDAKWSRTIYYMTVRGFDGETYYQRTDMEQRLRRLAQTSPKTFVRNLQTICSIATGAGALPVLVTGPLADTAWRSLELGVSEGNDAIRKLSAEGEIELIDLAAVFPTDDSSLFYRTADPMHMSKKGSIVKANLIADDLIPILCRQQPALACSPD